jgi:hypothetical protein
MSSTRQRLTSGPKPGHAAVQGYHLESTEIRGTSFRSKRMMSDTGEGDGQPPCAERTVRENVGRVLDTLPTYSVREIE